jgi:hypothetical protein
VKNAARPANTMPVMNKIGAMHGNKETARGRAMAKKHAADAHKRVNVGDLMRRGKSDHDEDD